MNLLNADYNPADVMMGAGNGGAYISTSGLPPGLPSGTRFDSVKTEDPSSDSTKVLGAESVRATGGSSAYRQNLSTFAGGQLFRPDGNLSFDPFGKMFGKPSGAGNDPVLGMPMSLFDMALSGNPFNLQPPKPIIPAQPNDDGGGRDEEDRNPWRMLL